MQVDARSTRRRLPGQALAWLLVPIWLAVAISSGCGEEQLTSTWKEGEIIIDGDHADWQQAMQYIEDVHGAIGIRNDRTALFILLSRLVDRAAKFTAITLSSIVRKTDKGGDPCRPVCITAEGTTFYTLYSLKNSILYYMRKFLVEKHDRYVEFINVENAPLLGAAIAGLLAG